MLARLKTPTHKSRAEEKIIVVYGNEVYLKDERVRSNERYGTMWHFKAVEINENAKKEEKNNEFGLFASKMGCNSKF